MGVLIIPRATRDFDFIIHLKPNDIDAFVEIKSLDKKSLHEK